jgi:arginyl-tRNA--protein-N-Asp/Glu arginylyltransferase
MKLLLQIILKKLKFQRIRILKERPELLEIKMVISIQILTNPFQILEKSLGNVANVLPLIAKFTFILKTNQSFDKLENTITNHEILLLFRI